MVWIEKEVNIAVDASLNEKTNIVSYCLWDMDHDITPPDEVGEVSNFL